MKLTILAVGLLKAGPEHELVNNYAKRFSGMAGRLGLSGLDIVAVKSGGGLAREGDRLLAKCLDKARLLRLDEHGPAWPSVKLAQKIAHWRDDGERELIFLIGGADGYSKAVKAAATQTLALGPQTWPHMMARVMIAEQIYRAANILAGTPYHKA